MVQHSRPGRRSTSTLPWWQPVPVIVMPVVFVIALAVLVLLPLLDTTSSSGWLELVRTALTVGVGTGAIMMLVLAWRRQQSHRARRSRAPPNYMRS
ncbi:hypothetical protein L3Q67_26210 [Saccharothrix sp. AJ9571]|nr:hypothetical protein L3Q67_26210 [Saccharothrix sp. AJ9571]